MVVPSRLCLEYEANLKEMGWLKKENILVYPESIRIENLKQHQNKYISEQYSILIFQTLNMAKIRELVHLKNVHLGLIFI